MGTSNSKTEKTSNSQTERASNSQESRTSNSQTKGASNSQLEKTSNSQVEKTSNSQTEKTSNSQTEKTSNSQTESYIRVQERCMDTHIAPMNISEIDELYSNESSMCKIKVKNEKGNNVIGTGFFCEINDKDIPFKKVLFTNNHILNEKNKENNIELSNEFEYLNKK